MMRREARWLGALLRTYDVSELSPMLSVGSGSRSFRARAQPWIESRVYEPLERRGVVVLHHELTAADGVDVVGDLGDAAVRQRLRELGVRSILCLNVFEHVLDREGLAAALLAALPAGGLLVVTVPRRFPYHEDPIDTMFRPSPEELAALFGAATVIEQGTISTEPLAAHWIAKPDKLDALRKVVRRGAPATPAAAAAAGPRAPTSLRQSVRDNATMLFASTEVTYVVVRRESEKGTA